MKHRYLSPSIRDYGSIAECTFATPALGGNPNTKGGNSTCGPAPYIGPGSKSMNVLQCDKFGEYSHS